MPWPAIFSHARADGMIGEPVPFAAIEAARHRIVAAVRHTETRLSPDLSRRCGVPVHLKCEHRQITGSFKVRGAANAVFSLPEAARGRGLVTVSTGNHGRAVAYAAADAGVPVTVCMSHRVPGNKVAAIRDLGAEIRIVGQSQDEAQVAADELVRDRGMTLIPPFDDPAIVAGQGTLGLEIATAVPEAALVVVPLSGGGLAAGVAAAVKALRPDARVIGVSMERGAAMHASLRAGRPVQVPEMPTLADSLGGGIGLDNRCTFAMVRALLDDVVLLTEAEIAAGIRHAYRVEGEILEGAGAVGIAALLADRIRPAGPAVLILSGGNIDRERHRRIVDAPDAEAAACLA